MRWNTSITSCFNMFKNLDKIKTIKFSYFNVSNIIDMSSMFYSCSSLLSIDFNDFNTSLVTKMNNMFYSCKQLKYLNLDNFDTSNVIDMSYMFNLCNNLISLNLNNFNTSSVTYMNKMFYCCYNLTNLNLANFDTSSVIDMNSMFFNCSNLKTLNLINFNTSSVEDMRKMFYGCSNLTNLNLKNFDTSNVNNMKNMFGLCNNLLSLDLNNFDTSSVTDMSNMFFYCTKLISLDIDNFVTSSVKDMSNMFYNCNNLKTLNLNNFNTSSVTKIDYMFNGCNDNLIYCINNETLVSKIASLLLNFEKNCSYILSLKKINDDYSLINHNFSNVSNFSENENIPYLNIQIDKVIIDCSSNDLYNGKCKINNNINDKDDFINNIKNKIINDSTNKFISNVIGGDKKDLMIKDNNTLYQITSSDNQNNNKYNNISSIILGECEDILKKEYKIDNNQPLLIFKIDYFQPDSLIPIIGYEVFHPITKEKLDLRLCKEALINFNIPVSFDENNLFKYDPENQYYQDECYPSTTDNGTDILLNDRQNEFNDNNMSICENNCSFKEYDNETKKVNCECKIKSKELVISELMNQTDILSYNFTDNGQSYNILTMKCYYTLFTKEGLYKNIGSYILLFTIILLLISSIIFCNCGYHFLEHEIKEIIEFKEENIKENNNQKIDIKETMIINDKKITKSKQPKNGKKKKRRISSKVNEMSSNSSSIINVNKFINNNISEKNLKINAESMNLINYNDYELNSLSYIDALKYDKRTFKNYYISLIKVKHPLLFSFCPNNDYNSTIVKIDLFFLPFTIYYFINTLFFDESTIHKIYEDEGIYNFAYLIRYIAYSFIISHTIVTIIKYFALSERNIYEVKSEKSLDKAKDKVPKVKRTLLIKYICFYCLSLLLLAFFWYYFSSFGAVYQNTQIHLIKNIIISFSFSLIYPFVINFIPCILRIYSLKELNRECMYKTSRIFQLI